MCNEEGEARAAVFVGVHLYRVAPSLYNPILGVGLVVDKAHFCDPPAPPSGWGGRVTLSVCLRVLFSAPKWMIAAPNPATGLTIILNLSTHPCVPTPFFPIPSKIHLEAPPERAHMCARHLNILSFFSVFTDTELKVVAVFPVAAFVKSTPVCYQIQDRIILAIF